MKKKYLQVWLILALMIQGCVSSPNMVKPTQTQVVVTPSPLVSSSTIALPTQSTYGQSSTMTPTFATNETATSTLEPTQTVLKSCLTVLAGLPPEKTYPGIIVLLGVNNNPGGSYDTYSYDLSSHQILSMAPFKAFGVAVSPDGTKYAVLDPGDSQIRIYSLYGALLKTVDKGQYDYAIDQWLDDAHIALVVNQPEPGVANYLKYPADEVVINVLNGEKTMLFADYPGIGGDVSMQWEGRSTTKYDPTFSLVVYPTSLKVDSLKYVEAYALYDRINRVTIAQKAVGQYTTIPIWSPDGSKFVINDTNGDGEFYVITRDGKISKISHINDGISNKDLSKMKASERYSWSPDGRYLALWLETLKLEKGSVETTFAILDTETGKMTDYCISGGLTLQSFGGGLISTLYKPYWSPDGKSVVTVANRQENGNFDVVLIDLAGGFASKIADNLVPRGWLDSAK